MLQVQKLLQNGKEKLNVRGRKYEMKSEVGNKDFECSYPISHFNFKAFEYKKFNWPQEVSNKTQTGIIIFEVSPSARSSAGAVRGR